MVDAKRQKATDGKKRLPSDEEVAEEEAEDSEGLDFEDPYGDDLDDEEQQQLQQLLRKQQNKNSSKTSSSSSSSKKVETAAAGEEDEWTEEEESEDETQQDEDDQEQRIKPSVFAFARMTSARTFEDEVLECDWSAYEFFHKLQTAWPCLSFDFIPDQLGAVRSRCPHTCYAVGGTQSANNTDVLYVMKWDKLHTTKHDGDASNTDEESDEEEGSDEDARLDFRMISHQGAVNRIRCCSNMPRLVAAWSERGVVGIWDIDAHLKRLDDPGAAGPPPDPHKKPTFEFKGHGEEGFAMDWNPLHVGKLLTGDVKGQVFLWLPREGGWDVQNLFGASKKGSKGNRQKQRKEEMQSSTVEELQWKPREDGRGEIFAACSNDGSIKLWDLRVALSAPATAIVQAHEADVNALRFSPVHAHLLLSGGEEGSLKVFDLRCVHMPLAEMDWHKKPITCVDWHPSDEAVFAASCLDDSLTVWDMSVERDDSELPHENDIPDQLMFVHGDTGLPGVDSE
ncbi:hypothetical protein Esti_006699 [Eimeria stiedai]